ncbi:hypothetical protein [Paraburkholderia sp. BL17N1]|uniref:hypothetical protein n=1 Tax=Paraburkholderia sp. BL17N1 TaxID=1938798 RepID=UPI0013158A45|nr:hypothetical protein [Paraburkholderia sp. BL17N1]
MKKGSRRQKDTPPNATAQIRTDGTIGAAALPTTQHSHCQHTRRDFFHESRWTR